MTRKRFANFEARLERLIEGSFAHLFDQERGLQPRTVALQLARAIEDNATTNAQGQESAPTIYTILLNPDDYRALLAKTPDLENQLARHVVDYALEAKLELSHHPQVVLKPVPGAAHKTVQIEAAHVTEQAVREATQVMGPVAAGNQPGNTNNAQLIINGQRTINIDRDIFNIGRRPDNHLVLDDPLVSRHHVQLRRRHGRFVLYDAQSHAGTLVNNSQVREHILAPGDVITIGNSSLLFLEDAVDNIDDTLQVDGNPPQGAA